MTGAVTAADVLRWLGAMADPLRVEEFHANREWIGKQGARVANIYSNAYKHTGRSLNLPAEHMLVSRVCGGWMNILAQLDCTVRARAIASSGFPASPTRGARANRWGHLDTPVARSHHRASRDGASEEFGPVNEAAGTLCNAFQRTAAATPAALALRSSDDTVRLTWRQYADRVRSIAAGLAGLGVTAGDTVGLMLTNRPEFHLVDTGALHAGATPFSIYNTLAPEQIAFLFGNAGNKVVVCESQFLEQIRKATARHAVEHIVCVDTARRRRDQPRAARGVAAPGLRLRRDLAARFARRTC